MKIFLLLYVVFLVACDSAANTYTTPEDTYQLVQEYDAWVHREDSLRHAELQGYVNVLIKMATEPPIYDEVSDSLAYEIALAIYKDSSL